jgi:hypothetical protein
MRIKVNKAAIRNASRIHFKGVDMRQRVNSRPKGYDRNKAKDWRKDYR